MSGTSISIRLLSHPMTDNSGRATVTTTSDGQPTDGEDLLDVNDAAADDDALSELHFYFVLYQVTVPVVFCIIIAVGVIGNTLVIGVTLSVRKMRSSTVSLLLLNLAVSDLLFLVVCVPFMAYHYVADNWQLGDVVCKVSQYTLYVTVYVTVYTLVAIAVLRFVHIVCWPHRSHVVPETRRRIGFVVASVWTTMLAVNSPILVLYRVKSFSAMDPSAEPYHFCGIDSHETHARRLYVTFFAFAYAAPLTIVATMYLLILRFLHNRRRESCLDRRAPRAPAAFPLRRGACTSTETTAAGALRSRERRRTSYATRIFIAVVVVFGLCWLPLHAHLLLVVFDQQPTSHSYAVWRVVCHALAYANSSVNPFIYHCVSADFRNRLAAVFGAMKVKLRKCLKGGGSSTIGADGEDFPFRRNRGSSAGRLGSTAEGIGYGCSSNCAAAIALAPGAGLRVRMQFEIDATLDDAVSSRRTITTNVEMCRLPMRQSGNEDNDDEASSRSHQSV